MPLTKARASRPAGSRMGRATRKIALWGFGDDAAVNRLLPLLDLLWGVQVFTVGPPYFMVLR